MTILMQPVSRIFAAREAGSGPKAKSAERVATSAFGGQSGLVLVTLSSSACDPHQTSWSELSRNAEKFCCSPFATRFTYAIAKKIVLRSASTPTRNQSPGPMYGPRAHLSPIGTKIMRNRYTPSNAVASLRVKGRENQQASSAQIALGAKAIVATGQARSSQYFTHIPRNLGATMSNTPMLMNVLAPMAKTYAAMNAKG